MKAYYNQHHNILKYWDLSCDISHWFDLLLGKKFARLGNWRSVWKGIGILEPFWLNFKIPKIQIKHCWINLEWWCVKSWVFFFFFLSLVFYHVAFWWLITTMLSELPLCSVWEFWEIGGLAWQGRRTWGSKMLSWVCLNSLP